MQHDISEIKLDIEIDALEHLNLPKKASRMNESVEVASQGVTPKLQVGGRTPIAKPARGLLSRSRIGEDSNSLWMQD